MVSDKRKIEIFLHTNQDLVKISRLEEQILFTKSIRDDVQYCRINPFRSMIFCPMLSKFVFRRNGRNVDNCNSKEQYQRRFLKRQSPCQSDLSSASPPAFTSPESCSSFKTARSVFSGCSKMCATREEDIHLNVLEMVVQHVPRDLVPTILSFAGPKLMAALSATCKTWRSIVMTDSVWKTLCEDMSKWSLSDPIPASWLNHYTNSPCVPIDYSSLEHAVQIVNKASSQRLPINDKGRLKKSRILLRPAKYIIREQLLFENNELDEIVLEGVNNTSSDPHESKKSVRRRCIVDSYGTKSNKRMRWMNALCVGKKNVRDYEDDFPNINRLSRSRAKVELVTSKTNEPLIRVRRGTVSLKNLSLLHNCAGNDIWNGNSAVQVQPILGNNESPHSAISSNSLPCINISNCELRSISGRGVVSIDGGSAQISGCCIHDCAATGMYVGAPGSSATISNSDIIRNGYGNESARRGIARGHSGIYLEQGSTTIYDCNISRNSLTGISAVSAENAFLDLRESDLVGNGTVQLELPFHGSISRRRSIIENNIISSGGVGRVRSNILTQMCADSYGFDLIERDRELEVELAQSPPSDYESESYLSSEME